LRGGRQKGIILSESEGREGGIIKKTGWELKIISEKGRRGRVWSAMKSASRRSRERKGTRKENKGNAALEESKRGACKSRFSNPSHPRKSHGRGEGLQFLSSEKLGSVEICKP